MIAAAALLATTAAVAVAALGGGGEPAPPPSPQSEAATTAGGLTPGELAGQRLVAGWEGGKPPKGLVKLIREGGLAGVILFDQNIDSRKGTRATIRRLQRIERPDGLGMPLIVSVDQEGGLVKRVPGPPAASAAEMGARGPAYARKQGRRTAASLRGLGINVDLAPVLDVASPGGAIAEEGRSFGGNPGRVIRVGVRGFAAGLDGGGVAATAKHFPGIGMIETNTDSASQKVRTPKRRLRHQDEAPFGAFAKAGGELVMLSLATYTAFSDRPAAFSRQIATGELRRRAGFDGVSITDGLGAAAAQAFGSDGEIALAAVGAGTDMLLYTDWHEARSARNLLRDRLARDRLEREEFERSAARVLALRSGLR